MKKWKPIGAVIIATATLTSISFASQPLRWSMISQDTSHRTALALAAPPVELASVNAEGKDRFIGVVARAVTGVVSRAAGPVTRGATNGFTRLRQIVGWSTAAGRGSSPQKEKDDDKDNIQSQVLRSAAAAKLFDEL